MDINKITEVSFSPVTVLEDERIIYLNSEINAQTAASINLALLHFESVNPSQEITIYINSPGGEIYSGNSVLDTMDIIQSPITTIVTGIAASFGALLLLNGSVRKALPRSKILLHQPLMYISNNAPVQTSDIINTADNSAKLRQEIYKFISKKTKQPYKKIAKDCDRDFILNAIDALDYGVIDEIVMKH